MLGIDMIASSLEVFLNGFYCRCKAIRLAVMIDPVAGLHRISIRQVQAPDEDAAKMTQRAMAERATIPVQPAVVSPGAKAGGRLEGVRRILGHSPHVRSLARMSHALLSADAPVQRVLTRDLPQGDFFKGTLKNNAQNHDYRAEIDASLNQIGQNWATLRARYQSLTRHGAPVPDATRYRTLATTTADAIRSALNATFSAHKRQTLVAAYGQIQTAERDNWFQAADAELKSYLDLPQLVSQGKSAEVIIDLLSRRKETAGGRPLFGDDLSREAARLWTFTRDDATWAIHFADDAAPGMARAAVDRGTRAITVTIGMHVVPETQKDIYQRHIADVIAEAFRVDLGHVGGHSVFAHGAAVGPLQHVDHDKIASLRLLYSRMVSEHSAFSAQPADPRRRWRVRESRAQFDAQVRAMNLDDPGKRTLLEDFPDLEAGGHAGLGRKAASHGIFHQNQAESDARGLGNPLGDAGDIGVRVITPELIEHMIEVVPNTSNFRQMGLGGGHDVGRLKTFVAAHRQYELVSQGVRPVSIPLGGVNHTLQVEVFQQYRWTGGGAPPVNAAHRPPISLVNWEAAVPGKTTVDHLLPFLQEGRRTYMAWRTDHPALVGHESFGLVPNAPGGTPEAKGPAGLGFAGYVRPDAVHGDDAGTAIRKLDTLFAI